MMTVPVGPRVSGGDRRRSTSARDHEFRVGRPDAGIVQNGPDVTWVRSSIRVPFKAERWGLAWSARVPFADCHSSEIPTVSIVDGY